LGTTVHNNNLTIYFPNKCGSSWADHYLGDFEMDTDQAAELYRQGCTTVLITRPPQNFFISAYRWCFDHSINEEIGILPYTSFEDHLDVCIGEAFKFNLGLTKNRLVGYAEHSWAGPSLQFEADISRSYNAPSLTLELGSDAMFDVCSQLLGSKVGRRPKNVSNSSIPALINKENINRMKRLYSLNKRWAGFPTYNSNLQTNSEATPETED
jgi:hypothetical protein